MKRIISAIMIGALSALLIYFFESSVFIIFVFGIICRIVYLYTPEADRRLVLGIMIAGFAIRVFLAVLAHGLNYLEGYHGISGDDLLYTVKSWALVFKWEGRPYVWVNDLAGSSPNYGINPFTWMLAAYYKIFGFHPVAAKLINCMIGTLIGWVVYMMTGDVFNRRAARGALIFTAFYPSLVRWSIANLKDPFVMFLFLVCIYISISAIYKKVRVWKVMLLVLSMVLMNQFAQVLYIVLAWSVVGMSIFFRIFNRGNLRSLRLLAIISVFVAAAVIYLYTFHFNTSPLVKHIYIFEQQQATVAKSDHAGYYLYSNDFMSDMNEGKVSTVKFTELCFRSVVNFMLTPFPWDLNTRERMLSYPQMILWYSILVLSPIGYFALFIKKPEIAIALGALIFVGITVNALAEGNIGSAFRHRDLYTPFFIMFACSAISDLRSLKNFDSEGSLQPEGSRS